MENKEPEKKHAPVELNEDALEMAAGGYGEELLNENIDEYLTQLVMDRLFDHIEEIANDPDDIGQEKLLGIQRMIQAWGELS